MSLGHSGILHGAEMEAGCLGTRPNSARTRSASEKDTGDPHGEDYEMSALYAGARV